VNVPSGWLLNMAPEHPSRWAAMRSVAEKLGIRTESLRRWVRQAEQDAGQRGSDTLPENFELRRANEILRKASAFFDSPTRTRQRQPRRTDERQPSH
jgi:transposase-like protein